MMKHCESEGFSSSHSSPIDSRTILTDVPDPLYPLKIRLMYNCMHCLKVTVTHNHQIKIIMCHEMEIYYLNFSEFLLNLIDFYLNLKNSEKKVKILTIGSEF